MSKEATKKFVENNGFICNKCEKVIIDGTKHKNQEDLCVQCKISDLETKLAESESELEKQKEKYDKLYDCYKKTSSEDLQDKYRLAEENDKLKQQLAEKETRIAELEDKDWYEGTIKQLEEQNGKLIEERDNAKLQLADVKNSCDYYMNRSNDLVLKLAEKEKEIENMKHFKITIGTMENNQVDISSTTYTNQDKIEFAIEKLRKAKFDALMLGGLVQGETFFINSEHFRNYIDNQINELKEGK